MNAEPSPSADLEASCACGQVRIALHGRIRAMLLCACRACQKATGTGHSAAMLVDAASLAIDGPVSEFARPAESGATFTSRFCPRCGTPLGGRSSRAPGLALVPAGLFGAGADWFAPSRLIFARSHLAWDLVDAGLPRHETYPERAAP